LGILRSNRSPIEVTVLAKGTRAKRPVSTSTAFAASTQRDVTALGGIPITTVARTLVDLCAVVPLPHGGEGT